MPTSLRGTTLRKHIATICVSLDISEHEVNDLADFMGHHEKIHKSHYRQSLITKDLAITRFLKYAQGEDTTDESDEDKNKDEDDPTSDSDTDSGLNTPDTSLSLRTKTRQSKQLPSKGKDIKNYINTNTEKKEVSRLASKRKISRKSENVIESDDECSTESDLNISNILSSKKAKQSKQVSSGKNNVNNTRKKKKTSPFGPSRRSAHKIRWTNDESSPVLSSFQTYLHSTDNKTKLPSFRKINELKVKYPVLKGRSNAQIKIWLYNQKQKIKKQKEKTKKKQTIT
ncbi:uncharacterized protein [Temnothorax nylanderi]|uniref:uncharacterized protein n=1 Tax=Temnothorax nylanderi TaxID=102681 RepID=UPI003A8609B8